MFKKLIGALLLAVTFATPVLAAEGGMEWDRAPNRVNHLASLQNGAKLFVNYCLNCHSANSMRYNKLTELGLTEEQIKENLLFTGDKVGELMHVAMSPADAKAWFGAAPPDLSVMARAKAANMGQDGTDYIYTYLRTFYRDASRPLGWNNLLFPNVGMPHAMWNLQGPRELETVDIHPVEKDGKQEWRKITTKVDSEGFKSVVSDEPLPEYHGSASSHSTLKYLDPSKQAQFDNDVADLTAFLGWMSEPEQLLRKKLGVWVLLFLGLFFIVVWRLNASYWKHVK